MSSHLKKMTREYRDEDDHDHDSDADYIGSSSTSEIVILLSTL